jgi:hypothetical protein
MGIEIVSQKDSYTTYSVNGVILKTWTIVGGRIAVSFDDWSFSERLGTKNGYIERGLNQCPELSDFNDGANTLLDFVSRNIPKKEIREKRHRALVAIIGGTVLKSRRFHDKDNGCYFYCELNLTYSHYIPSITVSSRVYGGRCEQTIKDFANIKWNVLNAVFSPLCDSSKKYEDLTDYEFNTLCLSLSNTYPDKHSIFYEEK